MGSEEVPPAVIERSTVAQSPEQSGIHLHGSAARQCKPANLLGSVDAAKQGPVEIGYRGVSGLGGHNVPGSA
jgi:hypothetical protein